MYSKLVLSGGGLKGSLYIGMLKYFEENEIILEYLNEVVGTSIGSLIGLAIILGYTYLELKDLFLQINFDDLKEMSLDNLENGYGFNDGKKAEELVKMLLIKKEFDPEIGLLELYKKTNIIFACSSFNVNIKENVFFDHLNNPEMKVSLAVLCSMSIPIIFCAVIYNENHYVDGGLTCNLPIKYIVNKYSGNLNILKKTLSVVFEENNYITNTKINSIDMYLYNLLKSCFNFSEKMDKKFVLDNGYDLLVLKTDLVTSGSFYMTNQQKLDTIECGYANTVSFFNKKIKLNI
jgi:NTE family protein